LPWKIPQLLDISFYAEDPFSAMSCASLSPQYFSGLPKKFGKSKIWGLPLSRIASKFLTLGTGLRALRNRGKATHMTKFYTIRSNAIRAARVAFGKEAKVGVDFNLITGEGGFAFEKIVKEDPKEAAAATEASWVDIRAALAAKTAEILAGRKAPIAGGMPTPPVIGPSLMPRFGKHLQKVADAADRRSLDELKEMGFSVATHSGKRLETFRLAAIAAIEAEARAA
jgi:hypothetical protein